jgi:hypothetical protein
MRSIGVRQVSCSTLLRGNCHWRSCGFEVSFYHHGVVGEVEWVWIESQQCEIDTALVLFTPAMMADGSVFQSPEVIGSRQSISA